MFGSAPYQRNPYRVYSDRTNCRPIIKCRLDRAITHTTENTDLHKVSIRFDTSSSSNDYGQQLTLDIFDVPLVELKGRNAYDLDFTKIPATQRNYEYLGTLPRDKIYASGFITVLIREVKGGTVKESLSHVEYVLDAHDAIENTLNIDTLVVTKVGQDIELYARYVAGTVYTLDRLVIYA